MIFQGHTQLRRFNSRTPCGVRLIYHLRQSKSTRFQFTHPVWGATLFVLAIAYCYTVSIHAPRVGCDYTLVLGSFDSWCFNSRTPCGVRRAKDKPSPPASVSFNSRTPCGVRHIENYISLLLDCFNSRTPCGVRRGATGQTGAKGEFQFTHPVWGATHPLTKHPKQSKSFNSRTPCGVRHTLVLGSSYYRCFNSRTPCGVRQLILTYRNSHQQFQFTHPVWGATLTVH